MESDCTDGIDNDCDGLPDCDDTDCCGAATCAPPDFDKDGFQGCGDCNPSNPDYWAAPSEVQDLVAIDKTRFSWSVPLDAGTTDALLYEVLRSDRVTDFVTLADCLAPSPPTNTLIVDQTLPDAGALFAYLVRATNDCGLTTDVSSDGVTIGTNTLTVSITEVSMSENGGTSIVTVTRNSGTSGALVVSLSSNDTGEATVPVSATILDTDSDVTFTVTGVNDPIADGTQIVTITATAAAHVDGTDTIDVTDDEVATLTVSITAASMSENGGTSIVTVTRNSGST